MKKQRFMKAALVLLSLVAAVASARPDSVAIYPIDQASAPVTPFYCSYYTLVEGIPTGICTPFAALLAALSFGIGILYLVTKKEGLLKAIMATSFVSMTLAVLPVMMEKSVYMLPNVTVPICMGIVCLVAFLMVRKPVPKEEKNARRLDLH